MEIVLQWLDDLDDFVFGALLAWERLRRRLLVVGLAAALGCAAAPAGREWIPALAAIAAVSVAASLIGAAAHALAGIRDRRLQRA